MSNTLVFNGDDSHQEDKGSSEQSSQIDISVNFDYFNNNETGKKKRKKKVRKILFQNKIKKFVYLYTIARVVPPTFFLKKFYFIFISLKVKIIYPFVSSIK